MRKVAFVPAAFEDFIQWSNTDKKTYSKIVDLIKDIQRDPFKGLGKPEILKHDLNGMWSRRITNIHRLVYEVTGEEVVIISCKFHY